MTTTLVTETTASPKTNQDAKNDRINGVNVPVLRKLLDDVKHDRANGMTKWAVTTRWIEGGVSETEVDGYHFAGRYVKRHFTFRHDEPHELAGSNTFPNPQEYLMGALNACMMVGYVALSSLFGIELESVEIETEGEIDLRGFLGLDRTVKPGYDEIHYTVRIKGNGTPAQFQEIHNIVMATSPNRFNISQPVKLTADLIVN
jgi:uncharacterized OsmC-like protein